jgi:hypothetical protein
MEDNKDPKENKDGISQTLGIIGAAEQVEQWLYISTAI